MNKTIRQLWIEARAIAPQHAPPDDKGHFHAFLGGLIIAAKLAYESDKPMTENFADDLQDLIEGQIEVERLESL